MPSESPNATYSFDLFKLAKSKQEVDISPNTIRAYKSDGFTGIYKRGKAVFVSRSELEAFIKRKVE